MKYYTMSFVSRHLVTFKLGVAAFFVTFWIEWLNSTYDVGWIGKALIGDSKFGYNGLSLLIFLALFYVFDRYVWRWTVIRTYLLNGMPDLNGTWIGVLNRKEYPSGVEEKGVPVILKITQSFSKIKFALENQNAETASGQTASQAGAIAIDGNAEEGFILRYTFEIPDQGLNGVNYLTLSQEDGEEQLKGKYVSSFPRTGAITLRKIPGAHIKASRIGVLKGDSGAEYLGILVGNAVVEPHRRRLLSLRGPEIVNELFANRKSRDGSAYHITVVSPPEFERLDEAQKGKLVGELVDYMIVGLGHASRGQNEAYYIVVESARAAYLRSSVGLPRRDFHITIGFDKEDVHDLPKGTATLI